MGQVEHHSDEFPANICGYNRQVQTPINKHAGSQTWLKSGVHGGRRGIPSLKNTEVVDLILHSSAQGAS